MKLELYYYAQCPFCQLVLHKINTLKLHDKIHLKNTLEVSENAQYHLSKTGRSTVPCLYIDDRPMFESRDICDWLEKNKNLIL